VIVSDNYALAHVNAPAGLRLIVHVRRFREQGAS
jgi:hypothetical protein